jgi:hypothetical protein
MMALGMRYAQAAGTLALAGLLFCCGRASPRRSHCAGAEIPVRLADAITGDALAAIVGANHLGLGPEAQRVALWAKGRDALVLQCSTLRAGADELPVSLELGRVLARLNQWYGMTPATLAHPITPAELEGAALSQTSVARIAQIFVESIRNGVRLDARWIVPETGGESRLDGGLYLHHAPDRSWPVAQRLAGVIDTPAEIASFYSAHPDELTLLDASGILRSAIVRFAPENPLAVAALRRAAATVVENAATAYGLDPAAQFALIANTDWHGRYVGRWHTHPPHDAGDAWSGGAEPSFEDMQHAVDDGQFLTVSFQPDGFDLYDAAALSTAGRVDLSLLKVTRYRSKAWQQRFLQIHADVLHESGA